MKLNLSAKLIVFPLTMLYILFHALSDLRHRALGMVREGVFRVQAVDKAIGTMHRVHSPDLFRFCLF